MKLTKKTFLFFTIFLIALFLAFNRAQADENSDKLKDIQGKIEEYEQEIEELRGKQKTLASTISYLNNKIKLTETQIVKTEREIAILEEAIERLSLKIGQLDKTLNEISRILTSRIGATYKNSHVQPLYLFFSAQSFSSFFTRVKYLKIAQEHDRQLLFAMEEQKQNYDRQKDLKEKKQTEMEELEEVLKIQRATLAQQKESKQELLQVTKNDEEKFQGLLAAARAEMEAIQSIIAGKGEETEVGDIGAGERIASIISGTSACSTGTHLHFEVVKDGAHHNPASYLRSVDVEWDLCGWWPECESSFSFSGSWDWPVNGKPRITQGYGMSGYAKTGAYGGGPHTGLDMASEDMAVKSVKEGKLYRGSIACGGGTLRYVRLTHKEGGHDTYYLHVNYY